MPLSEHEERVLAEMERRLVAEDPRFVARTERAVQRADRAGHPLTSTTRRIRRATIGIVVGLACLLGLTFHIAFGIAGFALLLAAITDLVGALRIRREATEAMGSLDPSAATGDDDLSNGLR